MAGKKVLINNAGQIKEYQTVQSSAGAGNAGDVPALDSTGRLDSTMMPSGVGADTITVTTSEALSAGNFVNLWNSSGLKARKADATSAGKEANGFVLAAFGSGATATVYLTGLNNQLGSLTVGTTYYLDKTTPGGVVSDVSAFSGGNVIQEIGVANAAGAIDFCKKPTIVTA